MKRPIPACLSVFALLSPLSAVAADQLSRLTINSVHNYGTYAVLTVSPAGPNTDLCTRSDAGSRVAIVFSEGKEMYASVLSAHLSGRQIGFGTSGCAPWGETTIPKAYRVDLYK